MLEKRFYTIKELTKEVDRTAATIYAFIRSSEETKQFFNEHRRENSKGGYMYDEEVLELLKNKYLVESDEIKQDFETGINENPVTIAPVPDNNEQLEAELKDLNSKYDALKADYEKIAAEKEELLRQNGNLLLLLSQEKAEKQALLPPPRKTIGERIRGLFSKSEHTHN